MAAEDPQASAMGWQLFNIKHPQAGLRENATDSIQGQIREMFMVNSIELERL